MPDLGAADLILGFLLLITPVVFIHELGHYWVARKAGVIVDVFSVGFGPEIYGWTAKTGTRWRIAAIPLGGYVKMRGDDDAASTPASHAPQQSGSFAGAGLYWRMAIVAAGPAANFILGIALFAAVYMSVGKQIIPAVIGDIVPDMPAAEAGLQPGDKVIEIDGIDIRNFDDMRGLVVESPGKPLQFILLRDGRQLTVDVTPQSQFNEQLQINIGILGVTSVPVGEYSRLGPSAAIVGGNVRCVSYVDYDCARAWPRDYWQYAARRGRWPGSNCGNFRHCPKSGHRAVYFADGRYFNQFGAD